MKAFAWIPIALVAGLLIGAWGPRSEVRKCRAEVKELEELLKSGGRARSTAFSGLSQFLRLPDQSATAGKPSREVEMAAGVSSNNLTSNVVAVAMTNDNAALTVRAGDADEDKGGGMQAQLEKAADLWRVRSEVARSAFVANAGLDEEKEQEFDVVMAAMNLQLRERIGFWAEELKSGAEMTEETGLRMMNDMSSVLVTTYEEMDEKMPAGWRGEGEAEVNLTDFVDPMVAEPLIDVEDRIQQRPRRGGIWRNGRRNNRKPPE